MANLKYVIDDSTIIELLGIQNFTNKESAILELVKNAYDAGAEKLTIDISLSRIIVSDSGVGMNKSDFEKCWLHIGKSTKGYEFTDVQGYTRISAGAKGIGRFALARLGSEIQMYSYKKDSKPIYWYTDWNINKIEDCEKTETGTIFYIFKLRDKWTIKDVKNLQYYLSRTYSDSLMEINILYEGENYPVKTLFSDATAGINYSQKINLIYDAKERKLLCNIENEEFSEDAILYVPDLSLKEHKITIDIFEEFDTTENTDKKELKEILETIGNFSCELYFSLSKITTIDQEKFLYKSTTVSNSYNTGIVLYRNAFSISSFDGDKDWLELNKRAKSSPAAATHPTGKWRVRSNQISGYVLIDKVSNLKLVDLANRQGIDENVYFQYFKEIIIKGISEFERYRQAIIRKIDKKNENAEIDNNELVYKVIKNPELLNNLSNDDRKIVINKLKELETNKKRYIEQIEKTENRYKYDVRILNVLASSGLKAAAISHELKNDKNALVNNYEHIVKALTKHGYWDELISEEKTRIKALNVPSLLLDNKQKTTKILNFMNIMLNEIEKKQFIPQLNNILKILLNIKEKWENDYSWIHIILDIQSDLTYFTATDIFSVIFDNLILNSVQQNDKSSALDINIKIGLIENKLDVSYQDNGVGLPSKYIENPLRILEPHETSRENGHGLGMWIINNTLEMTKGCVKEIKNNKGFFIKFEIGDKI